MNWNQEVSTIIMFDNPADKEKAIRILNLLAPRSNTTTTLYLPLQSR